MSAEEFAQMFPGRLHAPELLRIITALPTDRLNELTDRARAQQRDSAQPGAM